MHLWEHFPGASDEHFLVRAFFLRKVSLLTRDSPAHKITVPGRGAAQSKAKHHEFRLSRKLEMRQAEPTLEGLTTGVQAKSRRVMLRTPSHKVSSRENIPAVRVSNHVNLPQ